MSQRGRPAYDPWRDVDGAPIPVDCQVVQIAIATEHGAIPRRLHRRGRVVRRVGFRVQVAFDGEAGEPASVRPFLIRVVASEGGDGR